MTIPQRELEIEIPSDFTDCGSLQGETLASLRLLLLFAAAMGTTSPVLVVSLRNVQHGGARFVGLLLETHDRLKITGRRLQLRNVRREIYSILKKCRLTDLLGV